MNEERGHATPAEGGPEALAQADPSEEFEALEVDAPRVGIVMGSKSDLPAMEAAARDCASAGSATRCA